MIRLTAVITQRSGSSETNHNYACKYCITQFNKGKAPERKKEQKLQEESSRNSIINQETQIAEIFNPQQPSR